MSDSNMPSGIYKRIKSSYWLGKKRSEKTKRKMSLSKLGNKNSLGYKHSKETNIKIGDYQRGRAKPLSTIMSKEKHWNWKGGISKNVHSPSNPEYKKWRSNIFERDNWTCQTCNIRGVYLEAHHIKSWAKYPELRFILDNGVALCKECHKLTDNYRGKANKKL